MCLHSPKLLIRMLCNYLGMCTIISITVLHLICQIYNSKRRFWVFFFFCSFGNILFIPSFAPPVYAVFTVSLNLDSEFIFIKTCLYYTLFRAFLPSFNLNISRCPTEQQYGPQTCFTLLPPCFCLSWKKRHLMFPPQEVTTHRKKNTYSNQREIIKISSHMIIRS